MFILWCCSFFWVRMMVVKLVISVLFRLKNVLIFGLVGLVRILVIELGRCKFGVDFCVVCFFFCLLVVFMSLILIEVLNWFFEY